MSRTKEEVLAAIETAFSPLRCVAEIWDYDKKIRFRVFGPHDEVLVTCPAEIISQLKDDMALTAIIMGVRYRIESKGFSLAPWCLA